MAFGWFVLIRVREAFTGSERALEGVSQQCL